MRLFCPRCGNAIEGADIDLGRGAGVCRPCGEIAYIPEARNPVTALLVPQASSMYRPESFPFMERGDATKGYEAIMPPNRIAAIPMLFFTAFWDAFMIVWYTIAITGGIWPMALFGVLHLGVGAYLTHTSLVAMLNTRRLRIEDGRISFTNGPVPAGRRFEAAVDAIDAFAITKKTSSTRNGDVTTKFVLVANMKAGESRSLALTLDAAPAAEFVAERFNQVLAEAKTFTPQLPYRD